MSEKTEATLRSLLSSEPFELPLEAVEWLLMLWQACQVFDDVADGDKVERVELDRTIWNTLVAMPQNSFFAANARALGTLVSNAILKWQASDVAERNGLADAVSFVWRAGYYDIILACVCLCYGPTRAQGIAYDAMRLYGEKLEDYLKEFERCPSR